MQSMEIPMHKEAVQTAVEAHLTSLLGAPAPHT